MATDSAEWRKKNPEKHKEKVRKRNHRSNLLLRYGISVEQFNALVADSDGVCEICRKPESRGRRLSLDHDHQTGAIRGFLCSRCNLLLGNADDDPERLLSAAKHLQQGKEKPIPVILNCPECGQRHIDEGEFMVRVHATHACQHCGHVWRPAVEPTVGVRFLPGFKNAPMETK